MWLGIVLSLLFLVIAILCYKNRSTLNDADMYNSVYYGDACIFACIFIVVVIIVKLIIG